MWLTIASSISSPPTRRLCETTMPPSEMTATSVVPPPMSTIMFPVGSATGRPGADRGRHRLLDQVRLAGAGRERRLLDRALLDAGHARGHADDDARVREAVLVHLLDEVAQHLLGDVEVGDDAVLQRADRADRARASGRASASPRRRPRAPRRCAGRSRRPTARRGRCRGRARTRACWRCRGRRPCHGRRSRSWFGKRPRAAESSRGILRPWPRPLRCSSRAAPRASAVQPPCGWRGQPGRCTRRLAGWRRSRSSRQFGCRLLELDVTDEDSLQRAVAEVEDDAGAVSALVNNAGYSLSGAVESVPLDEARSTVRDERLRTRPPDPARRCRACAGRAAAASSTSLDGRQAHVPGRRLVPRVEARRRGPERRVALRAAGLRHRRRRVEPGLIATGFADAATTSIPIGSEPYETFNTAVGAATVGAYEGGFGRRLGGTPDDVAATIERAVTARRPRTRTA